MNKLDIRQFGSMGQASAASGIPLAILKSAKREGCPAFIRDRVDLGEFIVWWFAQDHESDIDWGKRDKRASALTKEVKLEAARDHVVDVSLVTRFVTHLVGQCFFGELERLAGEYPSILKGKGEVAIHEECLRQTVAIKKILRTQLDRWEKGEARRE